MRGLLDRLAAYDGDARRGVSEHEAVVDHLKALLNTRRGEAPTVPDYGIEDLSDLIGSFPGATNVLQASIRATIERFEPRLSHLRVRPVPRDDGLQHHFEITGRLREASGSRTVRLETRISPGGRVDVW